MKDILKEFAEMQRKLNDLGRRIDNLYNDRCNQGDADHAANEDAISDTQDGLMETFDLAAINADDISDCRTALEELYEMIIEEG